MSFDSCYGGASNSQAELESANTSSDFPWAGDFDFDSNFDFNFDSNSEMFQNVTFRAIDSLQQQDDFSANFAEQLNNPLSGLVGPDECGGYWDSAGNLYNNLGLPMYSTLTEDRLQESFRNMLARGLPENMISSSNQHLTDILEPQLQCSINTAESNTQVLFDNSIVSQFHESQLINANTNSSPSAHTDTSQSQDSQSSVPELTHSSPVSSPPSFQPATPSSGTIDLVGDSDKAIAQAAVGMTATTPSDNEDPLGDNDSLFGDGDDSSLKFDTPSNATVNSSGAQPYTTMNSITLPTVSIQSEQNNNTKPSPQTKFNLTLPTLPHGKQTNGVPSTTIERGANSPPNHSQFQPTITSSIAHSLQACDGQRLNREEFLDDFMSSRGFAAPSSSSNVSRTDKENIALAEAEASYVQYLIAIGEPQNRFRTRYHNLENPGHQQVVPNCGYGPIPINKANNPSSSPQKKSHATMNEILAAPKVANAPVPKARSRAQSKASSTTSSSQNSANNIAAVSTVTAKTQARNRKMRVQPFAKDGPLIPIRDNDGQLQMVRPDVYYHEAVVKTYLPPLSPILQPVNMAAVAAMVDNSGVTTKTRARNPKFRVSQPVSAQQPTMIQQTSSSAPHLMAAQQKRVPIQQWAPDQQQSAYRSPYGAPSVNVQQQSYAPQVGPSQQFGFNQQQPGMNNHPNFNQQPGFSQHAGMNRQSRPTMFYNPHLTIGIDYSNGPPPDQFEEVSPFHTQFQPSSKDQTIVDEQDGLFVVQSSPSKKVQAQQSNSFMHRRQGSSSMGQVEEVNRAQASASPAKSLKRTHEFENADEYEEFQQWMEFKKMKKARASGSGL